MKRLAVLILALLFILSSTACALDFNFGDMLGDFTSMFSPDADKAYGPQELVETEDINIELTNLIEVQNSNMYSLDEDNEYVIIEFSIENKKDKDLSLSTMMSFSTWCDGELCTVSLEALGTAMFAGKVQLDCVVESGDSVTGVIGYEVPKDWKELVIQYKGESIIGKSIDFAVVR